MAFPDDPRDLKTSFAFGSPASADPTSLTYEQISPNPDDDTDPGPVLGEVRITRGRVGDSSRVTPTRIETGLRNTDGEFSPRNVSSPRWPTLRKGTPMQVEVDAGSGDVVRARAAQPSWDVSWDGPGVDDRVPVDALGILSRIGRIKIEGSAQYRAHEKGDLRLGLLAYWPMENGDEREQQQLSSAVVDDVPPLVSVPVSGSTRKFGAFGGVTPGPDGALSATDLTGGGSPQAAVPFVSDSTAFRWRFEVSVRADAESSSLLRVHLAEGTSTNHTVSVGMDADGEATLSYIFPGGGASAHASTTQLGDGVWHHVRLDARPATAGADIRLIVTVDNTQVFDETVAAYAYAQPRTVVLSPDGSIDQVAHLGFWMGADVTFPIDMPSGSAGWTAFTGHSGESASDRITRLCDEENITVVVQAGDTELMGAQKPDTLLSLLRDCEDADHGILYELLDGRLGYKPLSSLYNQDTALTLTYGTEADPGDVSRLKPLDDDRDLYNLVTVARRDGSSTTAELTTGAVGTDETTGIGPRPLPVRLNLATDDQVPQHAGWILHETTTDQPRYKILIDLRANPNLISSWLSCDIGSRITVDGPPAEHAGPDDLDLILVGYIEVLGAKVWIAELCVEPSARYRVFEVGHEVFGRVDTAGSSLTLSATSSATSILVSTDSGKKLWTTKAAQFPFAVQFGGGEVVKVTDIEGTASPQTFTVVRSVNGVERAWPAGTKVQIAPVDVS